MARTYRTLEVPVRQRRTGRRYEPGILVMTYENGSQVYKGEPDKDGYLPCRMPDGRQGRIHETCLGQIHRL